MSIASFKAKQIFAAALLIGFFVSPQASFASTDLFVNLLINPSAETQDFEGWVRVDGGDGWAINGGEAHEGSHSFVASYEYGTLTQVVDLVEAGYTERFLDGEPVLEFSTYVKGLDSGSSTADFYSVMVILLDESENEITRFETGDQTSTAEWEEIANTFSDYGAGLRSVSVELRGKDANWWLGHYGPIFDDASLSFTSAPSSGGVPFPVQVTPPAPTPSPVEEAKLIFTDVKDESDYQTAIEYLYDKKVVEGYEMPEGDKRFYPNKSVNRAEFLKMVQTILGEEIKTDVNCFLDVKDEWFAPHICSAYSNKTVTGYADGTFQPAKIIAFEEMLAIAFRAYGFKLSQNTSEAWYEVYLEKAEELELLSNLDLAQGDFVTRGEAAQFLYNMEQFFSL